MNILEAVKHPDLFAPFFKQTDTWQAWFAFLAALFALDMTDEQAEIFRECTKRQTLPKLPFQETWLVVGRRGGKSYIAALIGVFLAAFYDYSAYLAPGERGVVMLLAKDRKQARVIKRYVGAFLDSIPALKSMVIKETQDVIELNNSIDIEIHTCSYSAVRGYTIVAAICDEIAFWKTDDSSANPDYQVLDAIRPAMATIPTSKLICLSSPYAKRGALYDAWRMFFGKNDESTLVWQADTRTMNPNVRKSVIDRAYGRDPSWASAEYGAEFRSDIQEFIAREVIDRCIVSGVAEIAYVRANRYRAFCDPAGGSGSDSMTLAIGHTEDGVEVLDCLREYKPPFSPESVVQDFSDTLKEYGLRSVTGDRYAGEWPRERFLLNGIRYEPSPKPKGEIYKNFLPLLNSGKVALLDNPRLITQLASLERRTGHGGRDSIDHPPGGHDDLANAAAGVLATVKKRIRAGVW